MDSLFGRALANVGWAVLGAALGALLGRLLGWPVAGAVLGLAVAVAGKTAVRHRQGLRLLAWVRSPQGPAPTSGIQDDLAELAYRVERSLHKRDEALALERRQQQQMFDAIEASPNGVLLLDENDRIDWCNAVAADHFGLDAVRDRLQPVTNLVRDPGFVAHLQQGAWQEPMHIQVAGRAASTVAVLVRPYGQRRKLVLTQDVTERLRNDAMRRDFVANVSHEIRSPLTVLAGFVESMASLPLTEAERSRVLVLMKQQTDRMQALVSDLLTLAQLEGSPRPPTGRWVECALLAQHAEVQARALSRQQHQFDFGLPVGLQIAGNEAELQSALNNLVVNAVRYTPAGGRIGVHWQHRDDGCLQVQVSDTGPGIAAEHLPRLAERFYRVDGSRSRDTGGTGLGLAIVKHAVQRHGGELLIESRVGEGSTFSLLWPATRVREVPISREPADIVVATGT